MEPMFGPESSFVEHNTLSQESAPMEGLQLYEWDGHWNSTRRFPSDGGFKPTRYFRSSDISRSDLCPSPRARPRLREHFRLPGLGRQQDEFLNLQRSARSQ